MVLVYGMALHLRGLISPNEASFPGVNASQVALVVKNPPANAGDVRDKGLIPGSGRFPGEGNGNPLQNACLENSMDKRASWGRKELDPTE